VRRAPPQPFDSVQDLRCAPRSIAATWRRWPMRALRDLSGNRHLTFWQVAGSERELPLAPVPRAPRVRRCWRRPPRGRTSPPTTAPHGLTLGRHPLALLREELAADVS
jgi:error-prone DNA polymerase